MSAYSSIKRVPALDGWRGIAILLVLFDHCQVAFLGHYARPWLQTGQHGVTIFFVLSGFLITTKLLEPSSNLKQFYARRFLRLMPAAWAYLIVLMLLSHLTSIDLTTWSEVRSCILFYRNMIHPLGLGLAGHFWSLSLEEQFYLVWPCLLLLAGTMKSRWIAAFAACICAAYRWMFWSHYNRLGPNDASQVRADALLVGCLLAFLLSSKRIRGSAIRWSKTFAIPATLLFFVSIYHFHWLPPLRENIAIAILIAATQSTRALSFQPLTWLGRISYSVYIWQELFVHLGWIYIVIALPIFAIGSYYLIEEPCTRFGRRLYEPLLITVPT